MKIKKSLTPKNNLENKLNEMQKIINEIRGLKKIKLKMKEDFF